MYMDITSDLLDCSKSNFFLGHPVEKTCDARKQKQRFRHAQMRFSNLMQTFPVLQKLPTLPGEAGIVQAKPILPENPVSVSWVVLREACEYPIAGIDGGKAML